jgi:predicted transcriptional regulator
MRKNQLKRLPVINKDGNLAGILSVTDVLISARKDKKLKKKVYSTLIAIFQPRPIVLREISD